MSRGHKAWDAMPHKQRIKSVAMVFAYKDRHGIQSLCREAYMVKWITTHQDELLAAIDKVEV